MRLLIFFIVCTAWCYWGPVYAGTVEQRLRASLVPATGGSYIEPGGLDADAPLHAGIGLAWEFLPTKNVGVGIATDLRVSFNGFVLLTPAMVIRGILPLAQDRLELYVQATYGGAIVFAANQPYRDVEWDVALGWSATGGLGASWVLNGDWTIGGMLNVRLAKADAMEYYHDPTWITLIPELVFTGSYRF